MRNHRQCGATYIVNNTLLGQKQMCCFIYSLFVQIMYIIVNKATFMVIEIINPTSRNAKIYNINTTSLSHSINYEVKWQQSSAYSHFHVNTIQYFLQKSNIKMKKLIIMEGEI